MNNKCDYSSFLNEFNYSINRKLYLIPRYNGYIKSENYKKHLKKSIDRFKHDILYELPFNADGKPEVFLNSLQAELNKKRVNLNKYKKRIKEKEVSNSIPLIRHIIDNITKQSKRRIAFMQNKQLLILNNALAITEQAIESFSFISSRNENTPDTRPDIIPDTKLVLKSGIIWHKDKVGLIQLIKSLIKTKVILIGRLSENEALEIIASFFNTYINSNNLSNFSRAIHSNNNDYQPEIFTKILNGYEMIAYEKREKQENMKK